MWGFSWNLQVQKLSAGSDAAHYEQEQSFESATSRSSAPLQGATHG